MKNWILTIFGACITLFVVLALNYFKSLHLKDDKIDADDVFNEYLSDQIQKNQMLQNQNAIIQDFTQNLISCKTSVDSMKPPKIIINGRVDTAGIIRNAANDIISLDYRLRNFLIFDSTSNSNIARSANRVRNSIFNEFSSYERGTYIYLPGYVKLTDLIDQFNDEKSFINHRQSISNVISQQINALNALGVNYKVLSDSLSQKIISVKNTQKVATENTRDKLLITMVIPIFAFILSIIIFIPYFLRNQQEMFNKILDDKILIQVFTIFILVISILLLGIGGKLSGETLGTLLGGISVYVLQKSLDTKPPTTQVPPINQVSPNAKQPENP